MTKITIESGSSKSFKIRSPFKLQDINLSLRIIGLSILSSNRDYLFKIAFYETNGEYFEEPLTLLAPHYNCNWEFNPIDIMHEFNKKSIIDRIKIISNPNNQKTLTLELDITKKN